MISGVHNEVLMAGGYVLFLAAVAFLLEALARHSHKRSENYRNAGFSYKRELDQWECPMPASLWFAAIPDHVKQDCLLPKARLATAMFAR